MKNKQIIQYNKFTVNPQWVTGIVDAEGNFSINYNKVTNKIGFSFKVTQSRKNISLLFILKYFFKIGSIRINNRATSGYDFIVSDQKGLVEKVIPHFEQFPLQSSKQMDFLSFKQAFHNYINKADSFYKDSVIETKNSMNNNRTFEEKWHFMRDRTYFLTAEWLQGFIEGEGCFYFYLPSDLIKPASATLEIAQHTSNVKLLLEIRKFLNSGYVKPKYDPNDLLSCVAARSVSRLIFTNSATVINFIDKYELFTSKRLDYIDWKELIQLKAIDTPRTKLGYELMNHIKANMNNSRTLNNRFIPDQLRHEIIEQLDYLDGYIPPSKPNKQIINVKETKVITWSDLFNKSKNVIKTALGVLLLLISYLAFLLTKSEDIENGIDDNDSGMLGSDQNLYTSESVINTNKPTVPDNSLDVSYVSNSFPSDIDRSIAQKNLTDNTDINSEHLDIPEIEPNRTLYEGFLEKLNGIKRSLTTIICGTGAQDNKVEPDKKNVVEQDSNTSNGEHGSTPTEGTHDSINNVTHHAGTTNQVVDTTANNPEYGSNIDPSTISDIPSNIDQNTNLSICDIPTNVQQNTNTTNSSLGTEGTDYIDEKKLLETIQTNLKNAYLNSFINAYPKSTEIYTISPELTKEVVERLTNSLNNNDDNIEAASHNINESSGTTIPGSLTSPFSTTSEISLTDSEKEFERLAREIRSGNDVKIYSPGLENFQERVERSRLEYEHRINEIERLASRYDHEEVIKQEKLEFHRRLVEIAKMNKPPVVIITKKVEGDEPIPALPSWTNIALDSKDYPIKQKFNQMLKEEKLETKQDVESSKSHLEPIDGYLDNSANKAYNSQNNTPNNDDNLWTNNESFDLDKLFVNDNDNSGKNDNDSK